MMREDYDLGALNERNAVIAYLRQLAVAKEKHARALRADTMQSNPEADRWCAEARELLFCAQEIEGGRHWR